MFAPCHLTSAFGFKTTHASGSHLSIDEFDTETFGNARTIRFNHSAWKETSLNIWMDFLILFK